MAGQLWSGANGFMASPTLSNTLRNAVQPLSRFLQFCDTEEARGKGRGDVHNWNTYGDTSSDCPITGLDENAKVPEVSFAESQGTVTIREFGIAVPFSKKYDDLSEHPVKTIIQQTLKNSAARTQDSVAHSQFDTSLLTGTGGGSGAVTVQTDGTFSGTAVVMTIAHVKTIADTMQERNIPVYDGENYVAIMRPTTLRPVLTELESIHQYTDNGWSRIMNGEKGKYEGIRFVTQTNIASEGYSLGDAAFFFGGDTITQVISCPLELRGKIPDDYGRSQGIMWYSLENFALTHNDQTSTETKNQARVLRWGGTG